MLSTEEVTRFLATIPDGKMRTVIVTAYAAGLRVFEVVALRVRDRHVLLTLKVNSPVQESITAGRRPHQPTGLGRGNWPSIGNDAKRGNRKDS